MKTRRYKGTIIGIITVMLLVLLVLAAVALFSVFKTETDIVKKQGYLSVYEKLVDGESINVLLVGDSIAEGAGASTGKSWGKMLPDYIKETYGSECNLTNVSMGGNTSIAGIVREKLLGDEVDYDLAIICYGENDADDENFAPNYEAIIRGLKIQYGNISIISILESSQREYTNKINQIIAIDKFYNIPIADTIKAFDQSGYAYEELVGTPDDFTHPNDIGHQIYLATIGDVIQKEINSKRMYCSLSDKYDDSIYIPADSFRRVDSKTFESKIASTTADIIMLRDYCPGENSVEIIATDKIVAQESFEWNYTFSQAHIYQITDEPVALNGELTITFSTEEIADSFSGIMLTNIQ
jgi:lysophospholipase L1-like esterase